MNGRQVRLLMGYMPGVEADRRREFFWKHVEEEDSWVYQGCHQTLRWSIAHQCAGFEEFDDEERQEFWESLDDPKYFNLG